MFAFILFEIQTSNQQEYFHFEICRVDRAFTRKGQSILFVFLFEL